MVSPSESLERGNTPLPNVGVCPSDYSPTTNPLDISPIVIPDMPYVPSTTCPEKQYTITYTCDTAGRVEKDDTRRELRRLEAALGDLQAVFKEQNLVLKEQNAYLIKLVDKLQKQNELFVQVFLKGVEETLGDRGHRLPKQL